MRIRRSARIIAVNETGQVLLFLADDPKDDLPPTWIPPGGGVEEGEDVLAAACREWWEECGHQVAPSELIGPIATAEGKWRFRGAPIHSMDTYFALRVGTFDVVADNQDLVEAEILVDHRWWSADDLEASAEVIYPKGLASLVRDVHRGAEFHDVVELEW